MPEPTTDPGRGRMIRLVHVGARALGLDDDARHHLQLRVTGKRSLTAMDGDDLRSVVDEMRRLGFEPQASRGEGLRDRLPNGPQTSKLRALWISAWHLGVIDDNSDTACARFVRRQLGIDSARWASGGNDMTRVIEALKLWLARPAKEGGAGVDWSPYASTQGPFHAPRARVLEAQWRIMHGLGLVEIADTGALSSYAARVLGISRRGLSALPAADADKLIRTFGKRIRTARKEAA